MKTRINVPLPAQVSREAQTLLENIKKRLGKICNLHRTIDHFSQANRRCFIY
jgi:hypothetical protein